MPKDKTASHVRVMAAAREEFLEYGFEKASMRRVGDRCDFTAAGLYRHCRDKADLFDQLVAPAVERIHAWMDTHLSRYLIAVRDEGNLQWQDSWIDMMREVVYPHMDEYHLL
ncbi:MAG: helix-turn-helix transcriptional regulator, partial [Clostridia bacterium]|nr:helix-turn-helix transcriptional regulator [Clostridia bacterium]